MKVIDVEGGMPVLMYASRLWLALAVLLVAGQLSVADLTPAERRAAFLAGLPEWRKERREEVRRFLLDFPHRDRWKWAPLLDSDDPELIARGNAGLRDTARDALTATDFLLAEKLYGDKLEPATHEYLCGQLRQVLADPNAWPYSWPTWLMNPEGVDRPYGSQTYYTAMAGILAGEVLGDPKLLAAGKTWLRRLLVTRNLDGEDGEYNSPNYSTFGLVQQAVLADCADDPEARLLAQWLFARMYLMQLMRYHPPSNQVAGPHSRGYADQQLGTGSLNLTLHDTTIPAGVFFDLPLARKYNGGYGAHRMKDWLTTWHVPDYVAHLATDKPYPYEVLSTSWDGGWNWTRADGKRRIIQGGTRQHTTYLTEAYGLGTTDSLYLYQPSGNPFLAHWALAPQIKSVADFRLLWCWYARDDQGPFEEVLKLRRGGIFRSLQHRNKVLMLYQPKDLPEPLTTDALRLAFMLSAFRPVEEMWVGDQRFEAPPATYDKTAPVFLSDGAVYAAILPLEVTDLGRDCAMRIDKDEHELLELSYYNYRGDQRTFSWDELPRIRNGFAFEIAARADYPSLAAFREHMLAAQVTDTMEGDEREAVFISGGDTLRLRFNPVTETVLARQVNGQEVKHQGMRSTCAVLSTEQEIALQAARITQPGNVGLWLLKHPLADDYAVWNLSGETVSFVLRAPAGTVRVENLGFGRLLLRGGAAPVLELEQLPGGAARIEATAAEGPLAIKHRSG